MIDPVRGRVDTVVQLRSAEIAGNLGLLRDRLLAPDPDPMRLHRELLTIQRDLTEVLIDLSSLVGVPGS